MNSRRKFLIRGSMASTALLIAKPFTTFANAVAPVTGFTINDNKLVFVHTGNYKGTNQQQTMKHIARLKSNTGNLVLLHAGNPFEGNGAALNYDASMNVDNNFSLATNDHKIIYKGNIKIGVISATEDETDPIKKINTVSAYLKKEKNCHIVVCLSRLGYQSKNTVDDLSLAAASSNLDIIIGGHATNFCKRPFIALNKNKEEVIINHAAGNNLALGKIEIDFDQYGKKRNIAFNNNALRNNEAKCSS